ncbi:MAG TPA: hypothetical protein VL463_29780 [Kofleriaceae bacterium]|nr:hypothetical protein [Kofleriaceae bacterium]
MNAVRVLVHRLDRPAHVRERLARRHESDLAGLLNAIGKDELAQLAKHAKVATPESDDVASLRRALWRWGAELEAGGPSHLGSPLQPVPAILGGRLVHQAPPRGAHPRSHAWPRPMPPSRAAEIPHDEPDTVEELLAAADRAIGVPLGDRGRDKGAWGARAAQLLGVVERGAGEPDWRGDVEIKTVPVARDASGLWRVREDPAISTTGGAPLAKLARTLWLVRADTTILSWYFLEWDAHVAQLVARYLHTRPKGPRGTKLRGYYLHKRFFAECGLLATLNGPAAP